MALVLANRVLETSITSGTGTLTLAGAVAGYQSFSSAIGNGNTCYYTIVDTTASVWETGIGTYTSAGNTLARTTVLSNSSGTAVALTLAGNTVNVFVTLPAEKTVYFDANGNIGVGITADGSSNIQIKAGTATTAPIELTSSAGTVMTSPDDGSIEYDGVAFYAVPIASSRGVLLSEHFVARTGAKTMTSNTSLQAIFGGGTGGLTNGALSVGGSTSYFFEASINVNTMSATSGNMGFSIVGAGTATFTSAAWHSFGFDSSTQNTPSATGYGGLWSSANAETGNIVLAGIGTACSVFIKGIFRINAAGTIIPSIQLTTANAAVIGANTWFKCYPVGTNTAVSVGNWS